MVGRSYKFYLISLTCQTRSCSKFTMANTDSELIRVPIGHAIVIVGEDVIRTGTLNDIQIQPKTMWTVILDTASESLRSIDQSFDLGSQPRANPN